MNTLTSFDADLITEWDGAFSASGTALLEPDMPSWSENIAVCDIDDDLDDDEAYFLDDDDEDEDDDFGDDYDDDDFEDDDYDTDSDDDFDDDDL